MLFLDSLAYDGPSFTDWSFAMTAITEIYIYILKDFCLFIYIGGRQENTETLLEKAFFTWCYMGILYIPVHQTGNFFQDQSLIIVRTMGSMTGAPHKSQYSRLYWGELSGSYFNPLISVIISHPPSGLFRFRYWRPLRLHLLPSLLPSTSSTKPTWSKLKIRGRDRMGNLRVSPLRKNRSAESPKKGPEQREPQWLQQTPALQPVHMLRMTIVRRELSSSETWRMKVFPMQMLTKGGMIVPWRRNFSVPFRWAN